MNMKAKQRGYRSYVGMRPKRMGRNHSKRKIGGAFLFLRKL